MRRLKGRYFDGTQATLIASVYEGRWEAIARAFSSSLVFVSETYPRGNDPGATLVKAQALTRWPLTLKHAVSMLSG